MDKKFKMMEDHLEVEAVQEDEIFLPTEEGKTVIGDYTQTTIQRIKPEHVKSLLEFIKSENEKAEKQLANVEKELDNLKDLDENAIDQKILDECTRILGKSTKEFKQKMLVLNNHIGNVGKKKNLLDQKKFITEQLAKMKKELNDLEALVK